MGLSGLGVFPYEYRDVEEGIRRSRGGPWSHDTLWGWEILSEEGEDVEKVEERATTFSREVSVVGRSYLKRARMSSKERRGRRRSQGWKILSEESEDVDEGKKVAASACLSKPRSPRLPVT